MKITQDSIQDAAGCLGATTSRAGMAAMGSRMAMEQYAADGRAVVVDVGTSAHRLIMSAARTGMSQPHDRLLAKTVQLGVLGGSLLAKQKVGVRRPIALARKVKARKASKAAAKSRRRNRQ